MTYNEGILYLCVLGVGLNFPQLKPFLLAFLALFFLGVISPAFPDLAEQPAFILVAIVCELVFALIAIRLNAPASRYVALCSLGNVVAHATAYIEFQRLHDLPNWYDPVLRTYELTQVLLIIFYARPVIHLLLYVTQRKKGKSDGRHYMVPTG